MRILRRCFVYADELKRRRRVMARRMVGILVVNTLPRIDILVVGKHWRARVTRHHNRRVIVG